MKQKNKSKLYECILIRKKKFTEIKILSTLPLTFASVNYSRNRKCLTFQHSRIMIYKKIFYKVNSLFFHPILGTT